jgi:hypothetical protein
MAGQVAAQADVELALHVVLFGALRGHEPTPNPDDGGPMPLAQIPLEANFEFSDLG